MVDDAEQRITVGNNFLDQNVSVPASNCQSPTMSESDDSSDLEIEDTGLLKKTLKIPVGSNMFVSRHLNTFELAALSFYWFGWSLLWMPLLVIIMPLQIVSIAGDESKGSSLGTTLLLGSLVSLICSPIFGALSDVSQSKYVCLFVPILFSNLSQGRRRPFMVVGTFIASIALIVMSMAKSLGTYSLAFLVLSIANNMVITPYSALVPDVVAENQRGIASGWLGAMSMMGYLFGGMITYKLDGVGFSAIYASLGIFHIASCAVTVWFIPEEQFFGSLNQPDFEIFGFLASLLKPFKSHDFKILFISRFLIQMGILTVQENLQFYVKDAIHTPYMFNGSEVASTPQKALSLLFLPMLLCSLVSSVMAGFISDYYGGKRKFILYYSGGLMAFSCFLFAFTRSFSACVYLAMLFGIGFGAFSAIDWALATDILPCKEDFAKDMGVWSLALVVPNVLAAPIAGNMLDYFEKVSVGWHLGYTTIFILSVGYYCCGSMLVKYIRHVQ